MLKWIEDDDDKENIVIRRPTFLTLLIYTKKVKIHLETKDV